MPHSMLASLFSKPNNKKQKLAICDRCLKNNCGCHRDFMQQTSNLKIPFMKSIRRDFEEFDEGVPTLFNEDGKIFSRPRRTGRSLAAFNRRRRPRPQDPRPVGNITAGSRARKQRRARLKRSKRVARPSGRRKFKRRKTTKASRRAARLRGGARNRAARAARKRAAARKTQRIDTGLRTRQFTRGKTGARTQPTNRFPRDKAAILAAAKLRGRARKEARDTGAIPIDQRQLDTRIRLGRDTGQEVVGTIPEQIAGTRRFTTANLPAAQGGFPINVVVTNAPSGSGGASAGDGAGRLSFEDQFPKQTGQLIALGRSTVDRSNEIQALSKFVNERAKFTNERAEFVNKKLVDIDQKLTDLGAASTDASEAIGFNKLLGGFGTTGLIIAGGIVLLLVLRR